MSFWKNLPQPIIGLAPMDGVTDAAFRLITVRHGRPDVSFTEFTPVERIVRGHDPELTDFRYSEVERPIVAQVFGSDPESFYKTAHVVCALGFDGIDINMGCPAKAIAGKGSGAGLIRTPDLARRILRRTKEGVRDWASGQDLGKAGLPPIVRETVRRRLTEWGLSSEQANPHLRKTIPVSVKTRLGYDTVVVEDWVQTLLSESPAVISIHGRTLKQQYRGEADWELIARAAEIIRKTDTLILGNGDIRSAETSVRRLQETRVHGLLLGRAAMGNPWIFTAREGIRKAAGNGTPPPQEPFISIEKRMEAALEHAVIFDRLKGLRPYRSVRKFLASYCRGFPHASRIRKELVHAETLSDVETAIQSFLTRKYDEKPLAGTPLP
ncbi:MAG TPA: tRNA-dihydrouridine synthase [Nitrospiria bacterium]